MTLGDNIDHVLNEIHRAARKSGRDASGILLVAVTKTHPFETIYQAYQHGLRHFGENRVEEGNPKIEAGRDLMPDAVWHMIGHIQSRKASSVPGTFDWVHSVDRYKISRRLDADAGEKALSLDALFEVNLSGEESKYGFDLSRWPSDPAQLDRFFQAVEGSLALDHLRWQGIMTMAPYTTRPETVRPIYRRAQELLSAVHERFGSRIGSHLSMGMSGDFEVAIEEGATIVRIGTAIFGQRLQDTDN
nr:YggS family pyridoxal phosphate-dependent enzyme [Anaerolineae bacterium]